MSGMTLKVDDNLVRPVIEKEIQMAIVKALGDQESFVAEAVKHILEQKVDSSGKPTTRSYEQQGDYLSYLVRVNVERASKEAIQEWVMDNSEKIKTEIKKQLSSKRGITRFVNAMLDGASGAMSSNWKISTKLEMKELND